MVSDEMAAVMEAAQAMVNATVKAQAEDIAKANSKLVSAMTGEVEAITEAYNTAIEEYVDLLHKVHDMEQQIEELQCYKKLVMDSLVGTKGDANIFKSQKVSEVKIGDGESITLKANNVTIDSIEQDDQPECCKAGNCGTELCGGNCHGEAEITHNDVTVLLKSLFGL